MYQASYVPNPGKSYLYDGHIRFVDDHLGMLHRKLESLGIADDTYIVFTSDHGEGFGEHGDYWGHGKYLYDAQIRVPLVLLSHRNLRAAPRRIVGHVNTVGLLPTLAALAGIELDEPYASRGFRSLLLASSGSSEWRYPSVSSGSLGGQLDAITLDGRYKLITDHQNDTREFFDLLEDPSERSPIDPERQPAAVRARLDELIAYQSTPQRSVTAAAPETHELDEREIRALEALGYVQ
jgi:arylsulfatase A-like enzyme